MADNNFLKGINKDVSYSISLLSLLSTLYLLLYRSAEVSWQLLGMFRRREVKKIYWTITKGLPQPHEGPCISLPFVVLSSIVLDC